MTNKKLLELAAKAIGIEWCEAGFVDQCRIWNPLTDDGDALRLAVKLKQQVLCFDDFVSSGSYVQSGQREDYDNDPHAATRRAIVRAAAEIGKEMR